MFAGLANWTEVLFRWGLLWGLLVPWLRYADLGENLGRAEFHHQPNKVN